MNEERMIRTSAAYNLRDLGGLTGADGRRVKRGLLFRSDDLCDLTRNDINLLATLGIVTVVDFRDRGEAAAAPDRLPESVRSRINIPIEAGRLIGMFMDSRLTPERAAGVMISVYRALANEFQGSFAEFMRLVADSGNTPLLFHCAAGKDRTGMAAALILSALGVDRKDIIDDYLLSNPCLANKYLMGRDYDETLEPLYVVRPEYLQAALDTVDNEYGGVESYLKDRLGIDPVELRAMYLE